MKIKAFFCIRLSGRMVILGEWLFAPTKWDAIHRIHNTHKSIPPLWGSALMLILSGVYTPAYGHSVPPGLPQQHQLNQP